MRASDNSHLSICNYCAEKGHISHAYFTRKSNRTKPRGSSKTVKLKDLLNYGFLKLFQEL